MEPRARETIIFSFIILSATSSDSFSFSSVDISGRYDDLKEYFPQLFAHVKQSTAIKVPRKLDATRRRSLIRRIGRLIEEIKQSKSLVRPEDTI